jgi:phosphotriesterase-related protein
MEHAIMDNRKRGGLTRREAIGLLGIGAGLGLASALRNEAGVAAVPIETLTAAGKEAVRFPKGSVIRTLLKDIPPEKLPPGATLFHEHLSYTNEIFAKLRAEAVARGATPRPMPTGPYFMEDLDFMIEEVRAAGQEGVACIVDGGHPDMGTSVPFLRELSAKSGMPIVKGGGYYRQLTYPEKITHMSEEELVEELVGDANSQRWGAFGEIGTSDEITPDERKMLRAVAKAHLRTGVPIFSHTQNGKCAMEQADIFEGVGVNLHRVVIGHTCCYFDPAPWRELHRALAKRGAYVGFDRVGGEQGQQDVQRVKMVLAFLEAGYADQALFASDFSSLSSTKRSGGGGVARAVTKFVPMLRKEGVKEETLHGILVDNPRRFLAFVPKKT